MQRLRSAQYRRQSLDCHSRNVVPRLLRGKRDAGCLCVKAHQPSALVLRGKAVLHHAIPDLASGPVLRDLLKKIIVRVEKEAQPRTEVIHLKSTTQRPFDVFHAVVQREGQFLQRSRSGFANVISAD